MKPLNKKAVIYIVIVVVLISVATFLNYIFNNIHHQKIVLDGKVGKKFIAKAEEKLPHEEKLLLRNYIITKRFEGTYKDNEISIGEAIEQQRILEARSAENRRQDSGAGERLRRAATTGIPEFRARGCHPQMKEAGLCNDN